MTSAVGIGSGDVVTFWREAGPEKWFKKDAAFDGAIADRFGELHAEAAAGHFAEWASMPEGALALVLLLDQFSRNMYRGSPQAFAQDARALRIARAAIDAGFDRRPRGTSRVFLHAIHAFGKDRGPGALRRPLSRGRRSFNLRYAREHERIIRRFGRFPHRNPILGRHMTPAEQAFIDGGGFAG